MGDKPCVLSVFLNGRNNTDDRYRVQVSCSGPGFSGWSYKDYNHNNINSTIRVINGILGETPKELENYRLGDNIKIPITIEKSNEIRTGLNLTFIIKGGSRRRRPSRKYKKSAKRVFRKKSRSTRRR